MGTEKEVIVVVPAQLRTRWLLPAFDLVCQSLVALYGDLDVGDEPPGVPD